MRKTYSILLIVIIITGSFWAIPVLAAHEPYNGIAGNTFDGSSSTMRKDDRGFVAFPYTGGYVVYKDVDFGSAGATEVVLSVGTATGYTGSITLRLGSASGKEIATLQTIAGKWDVGTEISAVLKEKVIGKCDLYVHSTNASNVFSIMFTEALENTKYGTYVTPDYLPDIRNSSSKNEIYTLIGLGLIKSYSDTLFLPNLTVTRSEYAGILYKILGSPSFAADTAIFPDVDSKDENALAIFYLNKIGVISGITNGKFNPYDFISTKDALVMAVRMLGYESIAIAKGGYPNGYLLIAQEEGLLRGINLPDYLRRESLAKMVYNIIQANYLDYNVIGSESVKYKKVRGILSRTLKLYYGEGLVYSNGITNLLTPNSSINDDEVQIDDFIYQVGESDAAALLGYNVEFYYKEIDGEKIITFATPSRNMETIVLDTAADQILSLNDSGIEYITGDNDKTSVIKYPVKIYQTYNGKAIEGSITDVLNNVEFQGKITYIENDDSFAVVLIEEYVNIVVNSVDTVREMLVDSITGNTFNLDDKQNDIIIMRDGMQTSLKNIKLDQVASIYQSKNETGKKFILVSLSNSSIIGTVKETNDDGAYINDKLYPIASEMTKELYPGLYAQFCLNVMGEIVTYNENQTIMDVEVGLLLAYNKDGVNRISEHQQVKLFVKKPDDPTYKGEIKIFDCAKEVAIDGVICKSIAETVNGTREFAGLKNVSMRNLVRYQLNKDGEIMMLDTHLIGAANSDDKLKKLNGNSVTVYNNTYTNILTSKGSAAFPYQKTPEVFAFWEAGNEDTLIYRESLTSVIDNDDPLDCDVYTVDGDGFWVQYVVSYELGVTSKWKYPFVYDKTTEIVLENGDEAYKICGYKGSGEYTCIVDKEWLNSNANTQVKNIIQSLHKGDVVRFKESADGSVNNAQIVLLYNGDGNRGNITPLINKNNNLNSDADVYQYTRFIYGEVIDRYQDIITVKYTVKNSSNENVVYTEYVNIRGSIVSYNYNNDSLSIYNDLSSGNLCIGNKILVCILDRALQLVCII